MSEYILLKELYEVMKSKNVFLNYVIENKGCLLFLLFLFLIRDYARNWFY